MILYDIVLNPTTISNILIKEITNSDFHIVTCIIIIRQDGLINAMPRLGNL